MTRLESEVKEFVAEHPDGWSHEDWNRLLDKLSARKIEVADTDQLGVRLEAERLRQVLLRASVRGLGPKRVDAIVEKYGNLWNLRQANPEQLAGIPTMPLRLAQETLARLFS